MNHLACDAIAGGVVRHAHRHPTCAARAEGVLCVEVDLVHSAVAAALALGAELKRPALEMEFAWSPGSHDPRVAAVNGKPLDWSAVQIDGVDTESLPLLDEPFQSVPSFFPWKDLSIAWGDYPWAIHDREADG